jgi:hypothetical protein
MKCFTHRSSDAVGVCRACQKGLCAECAIDHKFALSCRGDCESEVAFARSQNLTSRKLIAVQKRNRYLAPGFFGAAGVVFLFHDVREGYFSWFSTGLGSLFILFALAILLANRKWAGGSKGDGI